jgi:hypothetical protein
LGFTGSSNSINVSLDSDSRASIDTTTTRMYLVPSLLRDHINRTGTARARTEDWTDQPYSTCFFIVTAINLQKLTVEDLQTHSFLPRGLFERLIGKVVGWCQQSTLRSHVRDQHLSQTEVMLSFSSQRFRLQLHPELNAIQLNVEGRNPLLIHDFVEWQIKKIIAENMKSLKCFTALMYEYDTGEHGVVIGGGGDGHGEDGSRSIQKRPEGSKKAQRTYRMLADFMEHAESLIFILRRDIMAVVESHSVLELNEGRIRLKGDQLHQLYGQWIPDLSLLAYYDLFVAYRWGDADPLFALRLFHCCNFNLGDDHRAVAVFLDQVRLQNGRQFQRDFIEALSRSLVIVPIFSKDALQRFIEHDPNVQDNLLIEWILALELLEAPQSPLCRIFPIMFGARNADGSIGDLFSDGILDRIPDVVPVASLTAVASFLLTKTTITPRPGFESITVRGIVREMTKFQCFPAWASKNTAALLPAECAKHIEMLVKDALAEQEKAPVIIPESPNLKVPASTPAVSNASASASVSDVALGDIVEAIKSELRISDDVKTIPKILATAAELLIDDLSDQARYQALVSLKDKAAFLARMLSIDC